MAFWYLQTKGIPFGAIVLAYGTLPSGITQDYYNEEVNRAQSVYFLTLVIMQVGERLFTLARPRLTGIYSLETC